MDTFQKAAEALDRDYQVFLDYIESNEVKLSARTEHIDKKDCFAMNSQFQTVSEKYPMPSRTQGDYSVIDFFYFFSVRSGMLRIMKIKGKGLSLKRSERYDIFFEMSSIERYILMMAVMLVPYQFAICESFTIVSMYDFLGWMKEGNTDKVLRAPYSGTYEFWKEIYVPEIRLFGLFHLIRVEWLENPAAEENKKNKYCIKELYQTEEGYLIKELLEEDKRTVWYEETIGPMISVLKSINHTSEEDWEENVIQFWEHTIETGIHTFEFTMKEESCVRKIRIGGQYTLEDLHYQILESIDFDDEHLYYFQIGSGSSMRRFYASECKESESLLANGVKLDELLLYEGMKFQYLYDFGDMWDFQITVDRILNVHTTESEIIKVKGESPTQYGWF